MPIPEAHILKRRIARLIETNSYDSAQAIESFTQRLARLNRRIHQLPPSNSSAASQVLYTRLEEILIRFEELDSLGAKPSPLAPKDRVSQAIEHFSMRIDDIDERLDRLSLAEKLATSAVMHQELEELLKLFEESKLLQRWSRNSCKMNHHWRWN